MDAGEIESEFAEYLQEVPTSYEYESTLSEAVHHSRAAVSSWFTLVYLVTKPVVLLFCYRKVLLASMWTILFAASFAETPIHESVGSETPIHESVGGLASLVGGIVMGIEFFYCTSELLQCVPSGGFYPPFSDFFIICRRGIQKIWTHYEID